MVSIISISSRLLFIGQLILLLFPVPRSIIMCLFLQKRKIRRRKIYPPVEEHGGHGVVQLVHRVEVGNFRDIHLGRTR